MAISSDVKFERPWECRMPAFRVAGGLYFVGNTSGASWLLDTADGPVLFDTNYPTLAPQLLESIREAGFRPESIAAIFHTHGHYDHYGATAQIKALSGAVTYMSRADAQLLRQQPEMGLAHLGRHLFPEPPVTDVELEDEDVITIGGVPIRCVACPGHTPGEMTFVDHQNRILFSGDACNNNLGLGSRRGTPGFVSIERAGKYLRRLLEMKGKDFDCVYNSHHDYRGFGAPLADDVLACAVQCCEELVAGTANIVDVPNPMDPTGKSLRTVAMRGKTMVSFNPEGILVNP